MIKAKFTFRLDKKAFLKEMGNSKNRIVVQRKSKPILQRRVDEAFRELNQSFEDHPVTQEIAAGINASNISGTLSNYGNLFSFIGFARNARPLDPIRKELSKRARLSSVSFKNGRLSANVSYPSLEKIFANTPLPWASDSWARRIERGLAGFGSYLVKPSQSSRSGIAIQSNHTIRGGRFKNTSYLSKMFTQFRKGLGRK